MKKFLAVLLSLLMITSSCALTIAALGAAVDTTSEAITIDGKFDDSGWANDSWVNVNYNNANVQTPLKEGVVRNENYDIQFRSDDTNLYVAVRSNTAPVATDTKYGNGLGTFFRVWVLPDGANVDGVAYNTYKYIINLAYKPSGSIISATKNSNPLNNAGAAYTLTGLTFVESVGADYWHVEIAIPLAGIDLTSASTGHFYTTLSAPIAITGTAPNEKVIDNNSLAWGKYGPGTELYPNGDTMYTDWDENNDIDIKMADIKLGYLPWNAVIIDKFADFGFISTILTRVNGKTTVGEVSAITLGSATAYSYFNVISVDANGIVTAINQTSSTKVGIVIPDGGYVMLCSTSTDASNPKHTAAQIAAFKSVGVGDKITLYNIDLAALTTGAVKAPLTKAGFTIQKLTYPVGVTNTSNATQVAVLNNKDLAVLTDGNVSTATAFSDPQVVLLQNKVCGTAGTYPKAELVLSLDKVKAIDTVNLSFYQEYISMIGLPADNRVTISYAIDATKFASLGDFFFEGAAIDKKQGVINANFALGKTISAKYIKVSFSFGDSPFAAQSKPIWEFIGLTEFSATRNAPITAVMNNLSNADQVGVIKDLALLANGNLGKTATGYSDPEVLLFQNKVCATAGTYPKVALLLALDKLRSIDTVTISFYQEYNSMIGLPKDNKITVSYATDSAANYTSLGDYTFAGTVDATTKLGVIDAKLDLGKSVNAKYIKVSFAFGDSPFAAQSKPVWEFIGMTEFAATGHAAGVTNVSVAADVGTIAGRQLRVLSDGNKASAVQTFMDAGVFLFQNKQTAKAGVYPTVDLILTFDTTKSFNTVNLSFYHEYASMIGLPKDNKVTVSYSNDYTTYTSLDAYTFTGTVADGTKGVLDAALTLNKRVTARSVKISFAYGDSPFAAQSKPVWEFMALTEFGVADIIATGVNNVSNENEVAPSDPLGVLSDGNTSTATTFTDPQVVLFQNKLCTTAGKYPTVELIRAFDTATTFNTVDLSFYHEYNSMIGLPESNAVKVSVSTDNITYTTLGTYTFEGAAADKEKGIINAKLNLGQSVSAKYIKVSFAFGDSPFAAQNKPVWEFVGMTEFGVSTETIAALPSNALVIDNLTSYVGSTTTIITRTADKTTIGPISQAITGTYYDYNYFYLAAVDADGKVVAIDQTLGRPMGQKDFVTVPENGYVLLCSATPGGAHTQAYINMFKTIAVGDSITLVNTSVSALEDYSSKANLEKAGFTVVKGFKDTGVSLVSDITQVSALKDLSVLTDGNKGLAATAFSDPQVVLFQNLICKSAGVYPTLDLVLALNAATEIDTVNFSFYQEVNSMIYLPKDLKALVSTSTDGLTFTTPTEITFTSSLANTDKGVVDVELDLGDFISAKYIKVSLAYGDSGVTTDGKVIAEFMALTEYSVSDSRKPVSYGKTYTGTAAARAGWLDTTSALLTDGNVGTLATLGGNGPFVGFQVVKNEVYTYTSGAWVGAGTYTYSPDERDANGNYYKIIDLGESVSDLCNFVAKFGQIKVYGILFPTKVTFSASTDGTTFTPIGEAAQGKIEDNGAATLKEWADYKLVSEDGVTARYIRIDITSSTEFAAITAPTTAGTEGATATQSKAVVTAISEITVSDTDMSSGVVYGENAPVTTDYAYNVALNKEWSGIDYNSAIPQYNGDFTDGIYDTTGNFSYKTPWFCFYRNGDKGNISTSLYGEVTIDLGSDGIGLGGLRMQVAPGVGTASSIKVYASNTGIGWDEVGTVTYTGTDIQWASCTFEKELDARYIKVGVQNTGMFFMVSEIEVIKYMAVDDLPADAQTIDNFAGFSASTTLLTRVGNATTIGEVTTLITGEAIDYNYAYLVAVDANGIVTSINQTIGRPAGVKTDVVIPEGGYVLLCNLNVADTHTQAMIDSFKAIEVGEKITLYNVDLTALATAGEVATLAKAGFTVAANNPLELVDNATVTVKDGQLLGLTDNATIESIKAMFKGEVTVSGVGTGATVTAGGQTITIIVKGDINGDGEIDAFDYMFCKKAFLETITLTDAQHDAACFDGTTLPTASDYMKIKRHFLGTYDIFDQVG